MTEIENKKYQKLRTILELYLSNQYSYEGLSNLTNFSVLCIQKKLSDYSQIEHYFGQSTVEELKKHKEEMRHFSLRDNNMYNLDSIGIQLRVLLKNGYLHSNFTSMQIMSLTLLRMCYIYQGNLTLISQEMGISIDSLISYLSAPFLKDVLSGEALDFLMKVLATQNLYNCHYPAERKKYLEFLFSSFHQCKGNLLKLRNQTGHSISVLRTILKNRNYMVLACQSEIQMKWILKRLEEQQDLYDDLATEVENQILIYRHNMYQTYKELNISNYQVRKLIKDEIPKRNPVRGILVNGVLSTLDS